MILHAKFREKSGKFNRFLDRNLIKMPYEPFPFSGKKDGVFYHQNLKK